MNRLVQWGVVLGVWYALLVDVVGMWSAENFVYTSYQLVVEAVAACIVFIHGAMALSYWRRP